MYSRILQINVVIMLVFISRSFVLTSDVTSRHCILNSLLFENKRLNVRMEYKNNTNSNSNDGSCTSSIYTHGKKLSNTHSLTKHFYFDLINNPAKKQNRNIIESVYKWVY